MLRKIIFTCSVLLASEAAFAQYQSNSIIYMERRDGNGNVYRDTIRSGDMSGRDMLQDTVIYLPGGGTFRIGGGGMMDPWGSMPDMGNWGFDFNDPFSGFQDMDRIFEQHRRMMDEMMRGMQLPDMGTVTPPPANSSPNRTPSKKKPKGIGI